MVSKLSEYVRFGAGEIRGMHVRHSAVVICGALVLFFNLSGQALAVQQPPWVAKIAGDIDPPTLLSAEQQNVCQELILSTLSDQFNIHFTDTDVVPVQAPNWSQSYPGFLHGGGYNIHVVTTGLSQDEINHFQDGRFIGHDANGHGDALQPSLHIPGSVDGANLVVKTFANGVGTLDFTAHIDSAYADSPLGFVKHYKIDVLGHATRPPCP